MFKFTGSLILLVLCVLGARYLANPDAWNIQLVRRASNAVPSSEDARIASEDMPANGVSVPRPAVRDMPGLLHFAEGVTGTPCTVPRSAITDKVRPQIYRWADASGQIHFSDSATSDASIYDLELPVERDYFDLTIDYRGNDTVPLLQNRLEPQVTAIYKILAQLVGNARLRQVQLDVVLFPDRRSYHQYALTTTGDALLKTAGFYTNQTNAAVTWTHPDVNRTMEVARHESLHVIAQGIFGKLPIWLNEGLAEYFSQLDIRNQYTEIAVHIQNLRLARMAIGSRSFDLVPFLGTARSHWDSGDTSQYYALAWGLVYFMMESDAGRLSLASLLQKMADAYCQPIDSAAELASSYPGGAKNLQRDYLDWLRDSGLKKPHMY